jgi:type I restriction enzyme M protein
MVFNKNKKKNTNVLFIDASRQFESGKNQNRLREEDIKHIVDIYRKFSSGKLEAGVVEEKYAYVATIKEIEENDFNLNIPRYVDTFEEEEEVDISAVQNQIEKLENELAAVRKEMNKYLKELGV